MKRAFFTTALLVNVMLLMGAVLSLPDQKPGWKAVLAGPDELGQPLIVSGRVLGGHGGAVEGAELYVYHTDAKGLYTPSGADPDDAPPRLAARMTTNKQGEFEFRTIRPASYPGGRAPQHIHYQLKAKGHRQIVGEILFDDDPNLTQEIRLEASQKGWPVVVAAAGDDRIERAAVKLVMKQN